MSESEGMVALKSREGETINTSLKCVLMCHTVGEVSYQKFNFKANNINSSLSMVLDGQKFISWR